jgi:hypothetical protein
MIPNVNDRHSIRAVYPPARLNGAAALKRPHEGRAPDGAQPPQGRDCDRFNAVLAAAGYNFGLLLRWLERLLCPSSGRC